MAKKAGALLIKLLSTAGTGYFYVKKKNPRTLPNKLQLMKYDPRVKRHVLFTETKLNGRCGAPVDGVEGLVGNTPLVRIRSLSELTGCEILGKAEFLNPGGSIKDRVALAIVREAVAQGRLRRGGLITEGSAGSTGISLAMVAAAAGVACAVALPDDAAAEKAALLAALGARVLLQRPVSIAHPGHFVNVARRLAAEAARRPEGVRLDAEGGAESPLPGPEGGREGARAGAGGPGSAAAGGGAERVGGGGPGREENSSAGTDAGRQGGREACDEGSGGAGGAAKSGEAAGDGGGGGGGGGAGEAAPARRVPWAGGGAVFADQFENLANYRAHLETGAEIWAQTGGRLHAFVAGAGTGGTIAGVSRYLKARDARIQIVLVDPPGSGLFNAVTRGVAFAAAEAEGRRLRHPCDTITEGIGINRLTANFRLAQVDTAFQGSDREAVEMAAHLLRCDGLFLGSSAAMNCVGAVKAARALGPGHTIVTVLCDGGHRHLSRFHSPAFLASVGLAPEHQGDDLGFVA